MQVFSPFESSRSLNDQIVLSVINEYVYFVLEEMLNKPNVLHHEINK